MAERRCYDGCRDHLYHIDMGGGWYEVYSVSDGMCGHVEIENCDPDSPDYSSCTSFHWSVTSRHSTSQDEARQAARDWLAAGAPDDDKKWWPPERDPDEAYDDVDGDL